MYIGWSVATTSMIRSALLRLSVPDGLNLQPFHRRHLSAASGAHGSVVAHIEVHHPPPRMMRFAQVPLDNADSRFDAHAEGAAPGFGHAPLSKERPPIVFSVVRESFRWALWPTMIGSLVLTCWIGVRIVAVPEEHRECVASFLVGHGERSRSLARTAI